MNSIRTDFTPLTDLIPLTDSAPAAPESGRGATPEEFPDPHALLEILLALAPGGPVPPDREPAGAVQPEGPGVPMPPAPPIAQAGILVTADGAAVIGALTPSPSGEPDLTGRAPIPRAAGAPHPALEAASETAGSVELEPGARSLGAVKTPPPPAEAGSEGPGPHPEADPARAATGEAAESWRSPSKPARGIAADPGDPRIQPVAQRVGELRVGPMTEARSALARPEPGLPSAEARPSQHEAPRAVSEAPPVLPRPEPGLPSTEARPSQHEAPRAVTEVPPVLPRPEPGLPSTDDRGGLEGRVPQVSLPVKAWSPGEIRPPEPPMPAPPDTAPTLFDQLVRAARILRQEGRTEMQVRLEPPSLGWVRVRVRETGEALALQIDAERPETRALLSQVIPDLQQALASRGLEVASLTVRLDLDVARARGGPDRAADRQRREESRERAPARAEAPRPGAQPHVDLTI